MWYNYNVCNIDLLCAVANGHFAPISQMVTSVKTSFDLLSGVCIMWEVLTKGRQDK